jgi:hypothetical protein
MEKTILDVMTCGLFYKDITITHDDSSDVNKFGASLTDAARVIMYDRHMFIVQATTTFMKRDDNRVTAIQQ